MKALLYIWLVQVRAPTSQSDPGLFAVIPVVLASADLADHQLRWFDNALARNPIEYSSRHNYPPI